MLERETEFAEEKKEDTNLSTLTPFSFKEERNQYLSGHSKKHRGKHRSHTRGAGMFAFMRSLWMQRYNK